MPDESPPAPEAESPMVAWQRVLAAALRVIEASDALEAVGGLAPLAADWRPGVLDRAAASLTIASEVLAEHAELLQDLHQRWMAEHGPPEPEPADEPEGPEPEAPEQPAGPPLASRLWPGRARSG